MPCTQVFEHIASCSCPSGTIGDPFVLCTPREEPQVVETPVCQDDSDCPSGLACLDEKCQNPCYELSPCDDSAICTVVDTVPFRTLICSCEIKYNYIEMI